jgi:hypothetical protein
MSKKFMALALAAIGIVGAANAQSDDTRIDTTPSYLTFRGGLVFPLDDNLREASDLFAGIGIDYEFPRQLVRGATTYFSADWWLRTSNGDNGNVFPLAFNLRWYTNSSGNRFYNEGRSYFFVGAGAAIIDVGGKSSAKWMLRGGVGTEIGPNIIAEAIATFSDESSTKVRANAIGVYLGYKF